jgi:HSP20 family protein
MAVRDLIPWGKKVSVREQEVLSPLEAFRRDMERMFDAFGLSALSRFGLAPFEERWGAFHPQVDVVESDKEIKVSAELPGLDEKDVEVSLYSNMLSIRGEKKEEREERSGSTYRMERSYGSFQRAIPLPAEVETDKVEAVFQKGVLTITLPKREARDRKKITIKAD